MNYSSFIGGHFGDYDALINWYILEVLSENLNQILKSNFVERWRQFFARNVSVSELHFEKLPTGERDPPLARLPVGAQLCVINAVDETGSNLVTQLRQVFA